jgi:hypothetical protein
MVSGFLAALQGSQAVAGHLSLLGLVIPVSTFLPHRHGASVNSLRERRG